jgi:hypothetical protein
MIKKIELTQELLKELLHYDPETGRFTWRERSLSSFPNDRVGNTWNSRFAGSNAGYNRKKPCGKSYCHILLFKKPRKAHRLAWIYMYGCVKNEIDHINGNGLDNRISNLREVTKLENAKNHRKRITNKSGYTGVSWCRRTNKWRAEIKSNGKYFSLGYFEEIESAISARKAANDKYGFHINHGSDRPL